MRIAVVSLGIGLLFASCAQKPAPIVDAAVVTTNQPDSAAGSVIDACAIVENDQRTRLSAFDPSLLTTPSNGDAGPEWLPAIFTHCYRSKNGAWGLEVEVSTRDLAGNWFVVHVDAQGELTRALGMVKRIDRDDNVAELMNGAQRWDEPVLFDYSGDGEEELIVTGSVGSMGHPNETSLRYHFGEIWRYRIPSKRIEPYQEFHHEGFENIYGVTDFDGDGRPDLLMDYFYAAETTCKCGRIPGGVDYGPPLLFHAVTGGASVWRSDDDVARRFALKSCPEKPASLLDRRVHDARSREPALANVVCARIWGMSEADVLAKIAAECGPPAKNPSDDWATEEPGSGPPKCPDREGMIRWAKILPPVHLAK